MEKNFVSPINESDIDFLQKILLIPDKEEILRILSENKNNLELTADILLSKSDKDEVSNNLLELLKFQENEKFRLDWFFIKKATTSLSQYLNEPLNTIKTALILNDGKILKTILFILKFDEYHKLKSTLSLFTKVETLKTKSYDIDTSSDVNRKKKSNAKNADDKSCDYNYEYNELIMICKSNIEFKFIDDVFLQKSVDFFLGDIFKVIDLLIIILKSGCIWMINNDQDSLKKKKIFFDIKIKSKPPEIKKLTSFDIKKFSIDSFETELEKNIFRNFLKKSEIDLHGLTVKKAINLIKNSLNFLLYEESKSQDINNIVKKNTQKYFFICPVRIITGRGLHSHSSSSIIKKHTMKYLNSQNFCFHEDIGNFDVYGQKKKQL